MIDEELQQLDDMKEKLIAWLAEKGAGLLVAIIIIALGFWLAKCLGNLIIKLCDKRDIDVTLARFFAGFSKIVVIVFATIMALSKLNIEITPFIALLGASAFGLSLAVQGPVSNYGAGIVLIITRPFKVGDTLTLNGLTGIVDCVNLGNTQLLNEDEERITIPNRNVLGEIFTNSYDYSIIEAVVGIDYNADPENAIRCIAEAVKTVEGVAPDRAADVGIEDFGDSSINIGYRVWVPTNAYHRTRYAVNMAVFRALETAKITIPFPQRDVHLIQPKASEAGSDG
jgi:small conductance mechanosensitive channel